MNKIEFTVEGEPVGKGRPRFANGHAYTPDTTKTYEEKVRWAYKSTAKGKSFDDEPVRVNVLAFYGIPKATSKADKEKMLFGGLPPMKKPDIDNVIKIILDALNGIAYTDDKQVFSVTAKKAYSEVPRVIVTIAGI